MEENKVFYSKDGYPIYPIADNVYCISEFGLSTMSLIVGTQRALLIDCGTGCRDLLSAVREITPLPITLVATHAHVDHIGGRGQFDEIRLSAKDFSLIKGVNTLYRKFYYWIYIFTGQATEKYRSLTFKKVTKEPTPIALSEGDVIDLGGKTVRVYETPGHTLGSLSFLAVEDRLLFTGDVANPCNLMFLSNASPVEQLPLTLQKIAAIDGYDRIYASHITESYDMRYLDIGQRVAEQVCKKKNGFFPFVKKAKIEDFELTYRTNRIHKKS